MSTPLPIQRRFTRALAAIPGMSRYAPKRNIIIAILYLLALSILVAASPSIEAIVHAAAAPGVLVAVASTDTRARHRRRRAARGSRPVRSHRHHDATRSPTSSEVTR